MSEEEFYLYDIIDLISERHIQLRKSIEVKTAILLPEIKLNNIEWYIIDKVAYNKISLVNLSANIHKTRQAIHKTIKQLEDKNIVKTTKIPENKKEKYIILTEFGTQCYEIYREATEEIKEHINTIIGTHEMNHLKRILSYNWQL